MIEKFLKIKEEKDKTQFEYKKQLLKELYNLINKKLDKGVDYLKASEMIKYAKTNVVLYFKYNYDGYCIRYYFTEEGLKKLESKMKEYDLLD